MEGDQNTESFLQTVQKIEDINHINKIKLQDLSLINKIGEGGQAREPNVLCLVFEFIEGKTLDLYKVTEFTDEQKYHIIYQLACCMEYIHSRKFIHRDLKPENIMLGKDGCIYLIDFLIAKVLTNSEYTLTRTKGTLNYLAPECLDPSEMSEDKEIISKVTAKVDVWTFGSIVSSFWIYSLV